MEITAAADRPGMSEDRHLPALRPVRRRNRERISDSIAARLEAAGLDADFAHQVAKAHPPEQRHAESLAPLLNVLCRC